MKDFEAQEGIAILILYFAHRTNLYTCPLSRCMVSGSGDKMGGLKHFKYSELAPQWFLKRTGSVMVPFLEGIQMDLEKREGDLEKKKN